jgi:hypothetical protein
VLMLNSVMVSPLARALTVASPARRCAANRGALSKDDLTEAGKDMLREIAILAEEPLAKLQ